MKHNRFCIIGFLILSLVQAAFAQDHLMKPWNVSDVEQAVSSANHWKPLPVYQDREAWQAIRSRADWKESFDEVLDYAKQEKDKTLPALTATGYLDFQRTGNRTRYQSLLGERSRHIDRLALAECLEGKGEYLDALTDGIWAVCEESDWNYPAHTNGLIDMDNPSIDLRASNEGARLALYDTVFNNALLPEVRKRIRYELKRRIFDPYLKRNDFFWLTRTHNWNAVCNGNIARTAILFHSEAQPDEIAKMLTKAQNAMCRYLTGFGRDGGTAEGLGYWNYGFSNYIHAARWLYDYSNGQLDMLKPDIVKEISLLPARTELSPGHYPSFSDGGERASFSTSLLCYLSNQLNLPQLKTLASARMRDSVSIGSLDSLEGMMVAEWPSKRETFTPEDFVFLRGVRWMIARRDASNPDSLVLAAKGGRNDEPHNHNDVGNFIVHYKGESLIADLGAPVYDRDFFSGKRYSYLSARSLGHSVPMVNGHEQRPGSEAVAEDVKATQEPDRYVLYSDIASAYPPETGLKQLVRQVSLNKQSKQGTIHLVDSAKFSQPNNKMESALITLGEVKKIGPGTLRIQGKNAALRIKYDEERLEFNTQTFSSQEAKLRIANEYPTVTRLGFLSTIEEDAGTIELTIIPE